MNIHFVSGRELSYPRNQLLFNLLQKNHIVHYQGLTSTSKNIVLRSIVSSILSLPIYNSRKYAMHLIGFYGNLLMLPFSKLSNQPILFDAFVSTFDTLCKDRKLFPPGSLLGKTALWLDQYGCNHATRVIVDTFAQASYFNSIIGIPMDKIDVLPVGADEKIFFPRSEIKSAENIVLFYGSLLPLHGVKTIIGAAKILEKDKIKFILIGPYKEEHLLSCNLPLNIELLPPVSLDMLPHLIAKATICLGGHFSDSGKAQRTIAGKTYQCIAMGKPTIVGDNLANAELLTHMKDAWFCKMNDAQCLADAISMLINSKQMRDELGKNAYMTFIEKASNNILSSQLESIIKKTVCHTSLQ